MPEAALLSNSRNVVLAQDHSAQRFSDLGLNAAIVGNNTYSIYVLYIQFGKMTS